MRFRQFELMSCQLPFTSIQFPLYEGLKKQLSLRYLDGRRPTPVQAAVCGSIAGGIAAVLTTPLDVVKTRVMLEAQVSDSNDPFRKLIGCCRPR